MGNQLIIFWSLFFLFNYLLFLPKYLFNSKESDFFPYKDILRGKRLGFFASSNKDFFRYMVDVSLLIFLVKFKITSIPFIIISIYYIFIFIYNIYHQLFWTLYEIHPTFYNDLALINTGIAILWKESKWRVLFAGVGLILLIILVYLSFIIFLGYTAETQIFLFDWILASLLSLVFFIAVYRYYIKQWSRISQLDNIMRFIVGALRVFYNIYLSLGLKKMENRLRSYQMDKIRNQPEFRLKSRPDIYILFVESYGGILMQHSHMKQFYRPMIRDFEKNLQNEHWHIRSNLSRAPSSSAFSWLCYSSFLLGYTISHHTMYEQLLKMPMFYKADNLIRIFKNKGYTTYYLNPIVPNPRIRIDYTYLTPFYSIDHWILHEHMDYRGHRYGFSEAPPDQYSLHRGREIMRAHNTDPNLFFFLTKNSHSPFACPGKVAGDWRSLNHAGGKIIHGGGFLHRPTIENYVRAMEYQLAVIENFILTSRKGNEIYIVIGDHQPPVLNKRELYGLNTPVHLIAKDKEFINQFEAYGFRRSLFDESIEPVHHEAMYSILLREIIRNYGSDYQELPPYEPFGLQI